MFNAINPRFGLSCAALGLALAGCERRAETPAAPPPATLPAVTPALTPPSLGRTDLLNAIAVARSAYSAGQPDTAESLTGRQFAIRQAFGCAGPSEEAREGQASWSMDTKRRTIEIRLTPADWTNAPVLAGAGGTWEAVEGFWLTRPWMAADGCPTPTLRPTASQGEAAPTAVATAPVSGLASVFQAEGSRVSRRDGRAYELTLRGDPAPEPPVGGYRLLIEGRFSAFPDGRSIRCQAPSAEVEPVCVAAAEVDRVAMEDASGKLLREWRRG